METVILPVFAHRESIMDHWCSVRPNTTRLFERAEVETRGEPQIVNSGGYFSHRAYVLMDVNDQDFMVWESDLLDEMRESP